MHAIIQDAMAVIPSTFGDALLIELKMLIWNHDHFEGWGALANVCREIG
jgi:hypothetical protein